MEDSGLHISIGEIDNDLSGQTEDAIAFLNDHCSELSQLVQAAGVDSLFLDFGIERRPGSLQQAYFGPELLRLAGELGIGIALSQYPALDAE